MKRSMGLPAPCRGFAALAAASVLLSFFSAVLPMVVFGLAVAPREVRLQDRSVDRAKAKPKRVPDPTRCDPAWRYWSDLQDQCQYNVTVLEKQINGTLAEQDAEIERNFKILRGTAEDLRRTHEEFRLGNEYLRPQFVALTAEQPRQFPAARVLRAGRRERSLPAPTTGAMVPSLSPLPLLDFSAREPREVPRCQCVYVDKCPCLGACQALAHHCMALTEQIRNWGKKAYLNRQAILQEQYRRIYASEELTRRLKAADPELNYAAVTSKDAVVHSWLVTPKKATTPTLI